MKQKSQQRPSGVWSRSWRSLPSSCVRATGVVPGASGGQVFQTCSCLQHLAHILGFNITLLQVVDLPSPRGSVTLVFLHSSSSSSSAFAHSLSLPLSLSEFGFKHDISINYNSLSLNLSGLKSRANDGVAKTCVLSCVQQGATPLGVTVQKPVRRERASCSVKLFPGEFLVSGCILSLTEKSIKFILWISAHQRQQGGLFGGIYCLCKDTQEPPLTPHSFVPNVQTTSVDCLRPPSHWRQTAGLSPLLWIQPWRPQVLCCVLLLLLPALCLL